MINIENFNGIQAVHICIDDTIFMSQKKQGVADTQLFPIGCIFKSMLSILVGIAIQEGKIASVEDSVIDYVEHEDIWDSNWYKVKLKHALSKTTGLHWPGPRDPIPATLAEVMQLPFDKEPGEEFLYKPDPQIIVYLLEEVYRTDIIKLFESKILQHFQHKEYRWDREHIEGMQVSIDFLDELGSLMRSKGFVNGVRLFSEEYYEQCIQKCSNGGFPESTAYGLGWWLDTCDGIPYYYASGFGEQYVVVIPQKNMTISIVSTMDRPHPENKEIIYRMIHESR